MPNKSVQRQTIPLHHPWISTATDQTFSPTFSRGDRLLLILVSLEVLQNLTAYLRDQVVQIELVLLTAMTAVAR